MYLKGVKHYSPFSDNKSKDGYSLTTEIYELNYWRKHTDLHNYIVKTFAGGKDDCQKIYLGEEEIIKIIEAVKKGEIGISHVHEKEKDLKIFNAALSWLRTEESGLRKSIFYRASWWK